MRELEAELTRSRAQVQALLAAGDLAGARDEADGYATAADQLGDPAYRWYVPLWAGAQAATAGRVAEAEALGRTAAGIGAAAGSLDAIRDTFVLRYLALVEAGEIGPAVTLFDAEAPAGLVGVPGVTDLPLAALHQCIAGRPEQARAMLADASPDLAGDLPEQVRVGVLAGLAEVIWRIGGHRLAEGVYDELLPAAGSWAVVGGGAFVHGCVARPLGLLALLLERPGEAASHFGAALTEHRRAGAPALAARTLRDWAVGAGDRTRLLEAHEAYRLLGTTAMTAQLATLLRAIGAEYLLDTPPDDATDVVEGGLFRRDGEEWALAFRGRVARARDSNGVRDLARLTAEPGRPLPAEQLAATSAADRGPAPGGLRAVGGAEPSPDPRVAVPARIKSAIRRIGAVHPELAHHLERTVHTGAACSYDP